MLYLQEWRIHAKLTLKQLQDRTGIKFRLLSKYEHHMIDPVSERLTTIADALGIETGDLFKPPPSQPSLANATREPQEVHSA